MNIADAMNAAVQHHQAGRLAEAESLYRQVLAQEPNHAHALNLLGILAHQSGHSERARKLIERSIELRATEASFQVNHGKVLRDTGQLAKAITAYQTALRLDPNLAQAHNNLADALREHGRPGEAVASCRAALRLAPDYVEAQCNLGLALLALGKVEEAIAAHREAIARHPNFAQAYNNLSNVLRDRGELDDAAAAARTALKLQPDYADALNNLGNVLKDQGLLDEAIDCFRHVVTLKPDYARADSNLLYTLHFHPGYDARAILEEHRRWNHKHAEPLKHLIQPHDNDRDPSRRLRIGFVSPDFRDHVVGRFLVPLFEEHDHTECEFICYADAAHPDELTAKLQSHSDGWRSSVGLSDEKLCQIIREDRIDILVDLTMHMANNRMLAFARKPAPVQVTYLAYPGTTGLDTVDYRITDRYLDPETNPDDVYSERSIRLPDCYWCYRAPAVAPEPGALPALESGHVTFGCLNNFCKVTQPTLALWGRLLGLLPQSRLLLHAHPGSHRQRALQILQVEPQRVSFIEHLRLDRYFTKYQSIDIALDPFPYAGGTTTCDALWMGVPVVSLAGQTAVSRAGVSLLSNVGLTELVASSQDDYLQIATDLANDLPSLGAIRARLRPRMKTSALMDAPRFARSMEALFRSIWRRWCAEHRPT